jgi:hypothetical protein
LSGTRTRDKECLFSTRILLVSYSPVWERWLPVIAAAAAYIAATAADPEQESRDKECLFSRRILPASYSPVWDRRLPMIAAPDAATGWS